MSSWARTVGAVLFAGASVLWDGAAHASEGSESPRFTLAYDAPLGCPDRAAFVAGVRARTPRSELADEPDDRAIRFGVSIDAGDERSVGHLHVQEPGGATQERSVSSRTCAEVAKALALVVALILDPDAATTPDAAPTPDVTVPVPVPESPPPRPPPPPPIAKPPPPPTPTWHFNAGAELGARSGVGPALAPSAGLFVDFTVPLRRLLTPSLRVSADVSATSSDLARGTASYLWLAATARVCPLYLPLPARLRFGPCASLEVGIHRGTTADVPNPSAHSDLWLAPVAGASLQWVASRTVSLELEGGALFPLRRTRFFLAPATTIYEVPPVAGTVAIAARFRFR